MTWVRVSWSVVMMVLVAPCGTALATPAPAKGQSRPNNDPVLQARYLRASAQGISEDDLPPVPKSIVEPPPLPPPELHPRDQKGSRAARAARRGGKTRRASKAINTKKNKSARRTRTKRAR